MKDKFIFLRYGYADIRNEQESFEWTLVEGLKEFIKENVRLSHVLVSNRKSTATRGEEWDNGLDNKEDGEDNVRQVEEDWQEIMEKEINTVDKAWQAGVVHLIGESEVIASKGAGTGKRILMDLIS
ncbi:hypothetical protein QQP08_001145 [Theobroma cacao]|nr:hypothetical protein QQP08_001145 [Theobroma cacao]